MSATVTQADRVERIKMQLRKYGPIMLAIAVGYGLGSLQ